MGTTGYVKFLRKTQHCYTSYSFQANYLLMVIAVSILGVATFLSVMSSLGKDGFFLVAMIFLMKYENQDGSFQTDSKI